MATLVVRSNREFKNFGDSLSQLNSTPLPNTVLTPVGRAFLVSAKPFIGPIHTTLVGERSSDHFSKIDEIRGNRKYHRKIYAGAGGLVNLSYIAASKSPGAVLFDINPLQTHFWNKVLKNLASQSDRLDFVAEFAGILEELESDIAYQFGSEFYLPTHLFRNFDEPAKGKSSELVKKRAIENFKKWIEYGSKYSPEGLWLNDDHLYARLHRIAKNDAIGAVTIDVLEKQAWEDLDALLKSLGPTGSKIGLIYLSNIPAFHSLTRGSDFIGRPVDWKNDQRAIHQNVGLCLTPRSRIIECDNWERGYVGMYPAAASI